MNAVESIKAHIPLDVIIVGAGIGGLAAATACARVGMKVNVYEATSTLGEVGAGLQIGPNMSRLLRRWELFDSLRSQATPFDALSVRRYADDTELVRVPMTAAEEMHGAPTLAAHRFDLQCLLKTGAETAGARIHTGCIVNDIDFENARIKIINSPNWIQADVIIAADGVKSKIRKKMVELHGDIDIVRETGDAAWRVIVPAEQIYASKDTELIEILENSVGLRWMGPDGHIMCYPIRNHKLINIVLIHPDKPGTEESWTTKGDKKEMVEFYKTWNTRVKKLIDCVPEGEIMEWKLCDHDPLTTWVNGKVALMGDAAHPMLPYVAQGAAQAVEDGAVLSVCLAMIDSKEQINTALKVYELVRKERAETVQASAAQTRQALHLHDGKEQEDRDQIIRNATKGVPSPDLWSDKSFQEWCWNTDTQQQTVEMWDQLVKLVASNESFESPFTTKGLAWLHKIKRTDQTINNDFQATVKE